MLQSMIVTRSISGLLAAVLWLCALSCRPRAPPRWLTRRSCPRPPHQIDGLVRVKSDRYRLDDGLGLKAQTAFGLLYRAEDGWRGRFRPRDYALRC